MQFSAGWYGGNTVNRFDRRSVRISTGACAAHSEVLHEFTQSFQANAVLVPVLWYARFLSDRFQCFIPQLSYPVDVL
jgi:hypothetical protein